MAKYLAKVKAAILFYSFLVVQNVERAGNAQADALSELPASVVEEFKGSVSIETLAEPTMAQQAILGIKGNQNSGWIALFLDYLGGGKLPMDKLEARRLGTRA